MYDTHQVIHRILNFNIYSLIENLMRIIIYRTKLRRGLFLNQYPFELQSDCTGNGYESEAGRLHQIIGAGVTVGMNPFNLSNT